MDRRRGMLTSEIERLEAFGRLIRRARQCAGLSQESLAHRAAVSQTAVSRLERGVMPRMPLQRLLALQSVLGACLPLGICPHEHACIWQPRSEAERDYRRVPGSPTDRAQQYHEMERFAARSFVPGLPNDPGQFLDREVAQSRLSD